MAFGDRIQRIILRAKDETRGAFASVQKGLSGINTAAASIAQSFGLAFGIGSGGALAGVVRMANELDRLSKTAAKLGTTTEELSKLQFAAELTGVKAGTLEIALQRLTRRASEAAAGTGEAKDALAELGIDAEKFAELAPEEKFAQLADAFKQVATQSDRVRLAFKLFDSEGVALVNTLALGRQGLEAAGDELERFGGVVDSEAAAAAERFNDQLLRLQKQLDALQINIGSRVIPNWAAWLEIMQGTAGTFDLLIARADGLNASIIPGLSEINAEIQALRDNMDGWLTLFMSDKEVKRWREMTLQQIEKLQEDASKKTLNFYQQRQAQAKDNVDNLSAIEGKLTENTKATLKERTTVWRDYLKRLDGIVDEEQDLIKRIEQAGKSATDSVSQVQIGAELDSGDIFTKYYEALGSYQEGDVEGAIEVIGQMTDAMDALNEQGKLNIATARDLRLLLTNLAQEIGASQREGLVDQTLTRDQAGQANKAMEEELQPKVKLDLDLESVELIKQAAAAAMEGFSLNVPITTYVAGSPQGRELAIATIGDQGEPSFSDQSTAGGHRTP